MRDKNSIMIQILKALRDSRTGMSTRMFYATLGGNRSLESIVATASLMKRKGHITIDGKYHCNHCHAEDACWRITEQGRVYLRHWLLDEKGLEAAIAKLQDTFLAEVSDFPARVANKIICAYLSALPAPPQPSNVIKE